MRLTRWLALIWAAFLAGYTRDGFSQAVGVTLSLDTNVLAVGGTTFLHVKAQILPAFRGDSDRIFSWYIDVLNTNGVVATANYGALQKSASDNDPQTSSPGSNDGAHRRGIYDTFLNLPGAGVASPVELLTIPVNGLAPGRTRFQVRAGSGVPLLSSDFLVALLSEDTPETGGDYSSANIDLQVVSGACVTHLQLTPLTGIGGPGEQLLLSFDPCPGFNYTLEYRDGLNDAIGWRALPGAPHNSGALGVINNNPQRFYRLGASPIGALDEIHLNIAPLTQPPGPGQTLRLTYPTAAGYNYTVQFNDQIASGSPWQTLPGGPFNTGSVVVTNTGSPRFFRILASP